MTLPFRITSRLFLLLAALSLLAGRTNASVQIHCADGTPCSAGMRDCCMPTPCGTTASLRTCVISITPGSDRVAPLSEKAIAQPAAVALLVAPVQLKPTTVRLALQLCQRRPPPLPPAQATSPRGPPRA